MKYSILILLATFLLATACTKADDITPKGEKACGVSSKATVKMMKLNDSGSEHFYYLELENIVGTSTLVFPNNLATTFQVEGKVVEVKFNAPGTQYRYVVCLTGHVYDPNNADERYMPIVEVCSVSSAL